MNFENKTKFEIQRDLFEWSLTETINFFVQSITEQTVFVLEGLEFRGTEQTLI